MLFVIECVVGSAEEPKSRAHQICKYAARMFQISRLHGWSGSSGIKAKDRKESMEMRGDS